MRHTLIFGICKYLDRFNNLWKIDEFLERRRSLPEGLIDIYSKKTRNSWENDPDFMIWQNILTESSKFDLNSKSLFSHFFLNFAIFYFNFSTIASRHINCAHFHRNSGKNHEDNYLLRSLNMNEWGFYNENVWKVICFSTNGCLKSSNFVFWVGRFVVHGINKQQNKICFSVCNVISCMPWPKIWTDDCDDKRSLLLIAGGMQIN